MILTGDYHTHTIYSHGKGTVLENAMQAKEIGLKEIAITDHGFSHPAFGLRKRKVPSLIKDCREAESKTGVRVLVGVESNIISDNGDADLKESMYKDFDIFLVGMHIFILYKFGSFYRFFLPNFFTQMYKKEPSNRVIKETTKAYIELIKKRPIDIITHINYLCFSDPVEVAKAARDYGTYIELNAKKKHLSDEQLFKVAETGVRFVVDSDAHSIDRIGDTKLVDEQLERVKIDLNRIDNINGRIPNFRFQEYKKKHL